MRLTHGLVGEPTARARQVEARPRPQESTAAAVSLLLFCVQVRALNEAVNRLCQFLKILLPRKFDADLFSTEDCALHVAKHAEVGTLPEACYPGSLWFFTQLKGGKKSILLTLYGRLGCSDDLRHALHPPSGSPAPAARLSENFDARDVQKPRQRVGDGPRSLCIPGGLSGASVPRPREIGGGHEGSDL